MRNRTLLVLAVLLAAAAVQAGTPVTLPAPAPGDLSPAALVTTADIPQLVEPPREPVAFAWPLPAETSLADGPQRHTATSRSYHLRVTAGQLASGVILETTAPGAVVRINPVRTAATDDLVALDPSRVSLLRDGDDETPGGGVIPLATAEQLATAGVPFPEASSAFRIDPALGAGTFTLRTPDLAGDPSAPYVVSVVEPESPVVLELTADSLAYLPGVRGVATASLAAGETPLDAARYEAVVVAPDGTPSEASVTRLPDGTARITFALDRTDPGAQGMWEIHLTARGTLDGLAARRDVRTAFGYALPTARFAPGSGAAVSREPGGGLRITVPVEAAAPGRYAVDAVLWGTGEDGRLHPAATAQSAAWLEPGTGTLELVFDRDTLAATGLTAPWAVRGLELKDQGRMGVLETRSGGITLDLPAPKENPAR